MDIDGYSYISEQDFTAVWGVYTQPSGDLFQHADVQGKPPHFVWSVVDGGDDDDGNWYALPGFHVVNMLGYVMTIKPWQDDTPDAIYFLDDFDHDEGSEQCEEEN